MVLGSATVEKVSLPDVVDVRGKAFTTMEVTMPYVPRIAISKYWNRPALN